MKPDFSKELNRLLDPCWRKARIAARPVAQTRGWPAVVLARPAAHGATRAQDKDVANWLLDQA
jgi:hypothetical protein